MDIISSLVEAIFHLLTQITGSLGNGVPSGDIDCSQWVPPEVWPDGSPVEWEPVCGQEHWPAP